MSTTHGHERISCPSPFPDRLAGQVERRRSQIVLGLDPDPMALWPVSIGSSGGAAQASVAAEARGPVGAKEARELTAAAVARHCRAAIEAAGAACVAVKPQLACFERLGAPGWAALEETVAAAGEHDLLVIADGKRGDVPVTARAYAQALVGATPGPFGEVRGLGADAFTANPLLGRDAVEPLVDAAGDAGAAVFLLVRTSNPGAADVQDLDTAEGAVHERLALLVHELGLSRRGSSGLSAVGAVCGATAPALLGRLRELMPHAIFLLPGVGAQGGDPADLSAAFAHHAAGGLVTASRSIVDAHRQAGGSPEAAAAEAAERLRETVWRLAGG